MSSKGERIIELFFSETAEGRVMVASAVQPYFCFEADDREAAIAKVRRAMAFYAIEKVSIERIPAKEVSVQSTFRRGSRWEGQEMGGTIQALVSCQNQGCAEEVTYPLDMVRMWRGKPICACCYDHETDDVDPDWTDLPPVTLADLCK